MRSTRYRARLDYRALDRKRFKRYRVRCTKCHARRTLPKHPKNYIRGAGCRACGPTTWWIDYYRMTFELKHRQRCRCGAIAGRTGAIPHDASACQNGPRAWR